MLKSTMIHVRIDKDVKDNATSTFESMGLSLSDGIRLFLLRVIADRKLPFEIRAGEPRPNEESSDAPN